MTARSSDAMPRVVGATAATTHRCRLVVPRGRCAGVSATPADDDRRLREAPRPAASGGRQAAAAVLDAQGDEEPPPSARKGNLVLGALEERERVAAILGPTDPALSTTDLHPEVWSASATFFDHLVRRSSFSRLGQPRRLSLVGLVSDTPELMKRISQQHEETST
jgi:hypothetical protein